MHVLDTLIARGFVQQTTGTDALRALLDEGPCTFYVGFDPTADSLHVGHLVPVMAMSWLQAAGHRPIAVVGGGTAMVGDPSGRTEMRQMLTTERIAQNMATMKTQLAHFISFDDDRGLLVNNADWLMKLSYIDFLRDIGVHFSVNRMLAAEAYRQRLEKGLSFIEFNYQLLQAYDFLALYRAHGCRLQMGGDDQWGNILAGHELVRRVEGADVHALTQPLILTSDGKKMGKTAKGAVWLSADKLAPFDYFQYWVNVHDRDVGRFLRLYTQLNLDEIATLERLEGADIRDAKQRLAWEATALVHGAEAADQARAGAHAMVAGAATDNLPTHVVSGAETRVVEVLMGAGITKSLGEGRRLIKQGGVKLDNDKVTDAEAALPPLPAEGLVLRVGKKRAVRLLPAA